MDRRVNSWRAGVVCGVCKSPSLYPVSPFTIQVILLAIVTDQQIDDAIMVMTKETAFAACNAVSMMPPVGKRTKKTIAVQIKSSSNASKCALLAALPSNHKQKASAIVLGQSVHPHLSVEADQPLPTQN